MFKALVYTRLLLNKSFLSLEADMPDGLPSTYVLEKCDTSCPMVQLLNAKRKREEQGDLDPVSFTCAPP